MSALSNSHRFTNQVALVTGGTSGIGRAAAIAFAREGAKVVVAGRRTAEGNATVKTITDAGGEALFIKTDVTHEEEISALIAQTLSRFGRLDIAFNNAGVEGSLGPITGQSVENYQHIFDANVKGVFLSLKHEIPAMLRTGGGAIINTSSVAGSIWFANFSLYVASKHAVIGLTKSAALEYAAQRIRVNAISPAAIQTDMLDRAFGAGESDNKKLLSSHHPVGRIGTPEEIADAVLYLAAPGASFVTGHDLLVDGGFTAQ
jgi:NAD(P)-dependent dehydrogenase (short-subunit alcohol dehydrogenase family)